MSSSSSSNNNNNNNNNNQSNNNNEKKKNKNESSSNYNYNNTMVVPSKTTTGAAKATHCQCLGGGGRVGVKRQRRRQGSGGGFFSQQLLFLFGILIVVTMVIIRKSVSLSSSNNSSPTKNMAFHYYLLEQHSKKTNNIRQVCQTMSTPGDYIWSHRGHLDASTKQQWTCRTVLETLAKNGIYHIDIDILWDGHNIIVAHPTEMNMGNNENNNFAASPCSRLRLRDFLQLLNQYYHPHHHQQQHEEEDDKDDSIKISSRLRRLGGGKKQQQQQQQQLSKFKKNKWERRPKSLPSSSTSSPLPSSFFLTMEPKSHWNASLPNHPDYDLYPPQVVMHHLLKELEHAFQKTTRIKSSSLSSQGSSLLTKSQCGIILEPWQLSLLENNNNEKEEEYHNNDNDDNNNHNRGHRRHRLYHPQDFCDLVAPMRRNASPLWDWTTNSILSTKLSLSSLFIPPQSQHFGMLMPTLELFVVNNDNNNSDKSSMIQQQQQEKEKELVVWGNQLFVKQFVGGIQQDLNAIFFEKQSQSPPNNKKQVIVWIVDTKQQLRQAMELGPHLIQGVVSNNPVKLIKYYQSICKRNNIHVLL